jgi:hypothetical protein
MKTVSYFGGIVSQDPVIHLNCRTHQILALLASRHAEVDLLYCTALYDTSRIYDHVYRKRQYRWSYDDDYVEPASLDVLGAQATRHGALGIDAFHALAREVIARGDVLSFFAPRSQIPYQADYLRAMGVPVEGFLPHSFLLCGIDAASGDLLIRDDATLNHAFADFTIAGATVGDGYRTSPAEWFTDVTSLDAGAPPPRRDLAERRYRAALEANRDDHELYEVLRDAIPAELGAAPDVFAAAGVNALSMLAGSRFLFNRFLALTAHSPAAKALARGVARAACALLDAVSALYAAPDPAGVGQMQRGLASLRQKDEALLRLLKQECATSRASLVTGRPAATPAVGSTQHGG